MHELIISPTQTIDFNSKCQFHMLNDLVKFIIDIAADDDRVVCDPSSVRNKHSTFMYTNICCGLLLLLLLASAESRGGCAPHRLASQPIAGATFGISKEYYNKTQSDASARA